MAPFNKPRSKVQGPGDGTQTRDKLGKLKCFSTEARHDVRPTGVRVVSSRRELLVLVPPFKKSPTQRTGPTPGLADGLRYTAACISRPARNRASPHQKWVGPGSSEHACEVLCERVVPAWCLPIVMGRRNWISPVAAKALLATATNILLHCLLRPELVHVAETWHRAQQDTPRQYSCVLQLQMQTTSCTVIS